MPFWLCFVESWRLLRSDLVQGALKRGTCCIHTWCLSSSLFLKRDVLDNPHKQKTWTTYHADFAVELLFAP